MQFADFVARKDALSWGRVIRTSQFVASPGSDQDLARLLGTAPFGTVLPVGMRRSYGDSVLNSEGGVIEMTGLRETLEIDSANGSLRAAAGVTLDDILRKVVPLGYFVPVTPGTRFVTVGGAIANDVHGKNHHRNGTFGNHITRIGLIRSDGTYSEIGPDRQPELFSATIGGLGMTGIIKWAQLELEPIVSSQLDAETLPFASLDEFWDLVEMSTRTHEHTVAWADCTANSRRSVRGIFSRANWSEQGGLLAHAATTRYSIPIEAPKWLLNPLSARLFNKLYYNMKKRAVGPVEQHYAGFFHPLDTIASWNLLYGSGGFWQYQCVVPRHSMRDAILALFSEIASSGQSSVLSTLKTFGEVRSSGYLSFPLEGATLALDFPNRGERTLALLARLDAIVREAGGRLYAAKDGRIPREMWLQGYPEFDRFLDYVDPGIASDFWRRITR